MPWYKSGTVSVVQNSNAVIGTGTAFIANARVGDAFRAPDGGWYEVTNIASDTALSIAPNYLGSTNASGTYALAPMQGYVKDSADALRSLVNQWGAKLAALGTTGNYEILPSNKGGTGINDLSVFMQGLLNDLNDTAARATLSAAKSGANADVTSLSGLTTPLSVSQGGTGKITPVLEVGKGYIDGFTLVFNGRKSITVKAGSAYVPGPAKMLTLAADKAMTIVPVQSGFTHFYLFDNSGTADVETSNVAPTAYYNTAHQKTGDPSRRYLGSVLASSAGDIWSFRHDIRSSTITYIEGAPTQAPFTLFSGVTAPSPVSASTPTVVPSTGTTLIGVVSLSSGAYFNTCIAEQATSPAAANWITAVGPAMNCPIPIPLSRAAATSGNFLFVIFPSGTASLYVTGYIFER